MRTAVLLGATGLVGGHLLRLLATDGRWARVVTPTRRRMHRLGPRHEPVEVDFERLADHAAALAGDDVFCALGATIRKAGSEEAFRRIDLDYPFQAAQLARSGGASHFLLVSALGADPDSRIFYNRTKGEAERAVGQVGFPALSIFRPSLLTGDRDETRPLEVVMGAALAAARPLLAGPLRKYRATPAPALARAMVDVAARAPEGTRVYEADEIMDLARQAA
jgi:uncharacterized protein YbjT (DUF2867 family)